MCDCAACTTLMDSLAANEPTDEESSPTEESSPLEKNWVHILNDIKDVGQSRLRYYWPIILYSIFVSIVCMYYAHNIQNWSGQL